MHFYFPRRHRRRLLFPPGLLALACLLWLGCLALRAHEGQWRQRYLTDLTLPAPHSSAILGADSLFEYTYSSIQRMDSGRHYSEVYFTDNQMREALSRRQVRVTIAKMLLSTRDKSGMKVVFSEGATYGQLVWALNLMSICNIKKYWFDFREPVVVLYVLHNRPSTSPLLIGGLCGTRSPIFFPPPPTPFWVQFDNQVTAFWQFDWLRQALMPLRQPQWRVPLALLAGLAALSGWRVARAWRAV